MEIVMPDGKTMEYRVPVIRAEQYTRDAIFQKNLLFLFPFYIIRYEKKKREIEENTEKLQELLEEYRLIEQHLDNELLEKGKEKEYRDLTELITRIADYIFFDMGKAKKGIGDIMGGTVLELESDRLIRQGIEQGIEQGREQGIELGKEKQSYEIALAMLNDGAFSLEKISALTGLNIENVRKLKRQSSSTEN